MGIYMKQRLFLAVIILLTFFSIAPCLAMALRNMAIGDPLPDFRIHTLSSKEVTPQSLKGKILILAFWRLGQDFSDRILTDLERIFQDYKNQGVMVLAINADQAPSSEIERIRSTRNLSYPFAGDAELKTYGQFGVIVLPTTLILGPKGRLAHYETIHSSDYYDRIRGQVRLLLGEITPAELAKELNPEQIKIAPEVRRKAGLHLSMAKMLMTEKSLKQKARGELEKALRIDPSLLEAHILLAKLYREGQMVNQAIAELETALKLDPESEEAKQLLKIINAGQN